MFVGVVSFSLHYPEHAGPIFLCSLQLRVRCKPLESEAHHCLWTLRLWRDQVRAGERWVGNDRPLDALHSGRVPASCS